MTTHFYKALNPVDIKLPDNIVKGAVVLDEHISLWNPLVTFDPANKFTFISINTESDDVDDLLIRLAQELKLPHGEKYALKTQDPPAFITNEGITKIRSGFYITLTAAPVYYVARIQEGLRQRTRNITFCESVLSELNTLSHCPIFVATLIEENTLSLLYDTITEGLATLSPNVLLLVLQSLYSIMELSLPGIDWESVPEPTVRSVCSLVTGRAKMEDADTVLYAQHWIEQILSSKNVHLHSVVLNEVPFQSLIRHLDRSDERVSLSTLSLMNTIHRQADVRLKNVVMEELSSVAFRHSVSLSVLREGRSKDRQLLDQLIPLQRLLIDRKASTRVLPPCREDVNKIMQMEWLRRFLPADIDLSLRESGYGALLVHAILSCKPDLLATLCTENVMRDEERRWDLVAVCTTTLSIVLYLLGVEEEAASDEALCRLVSLLFSLDNPILSLFSVVLRLFHKTWREMGAVSGEVEKVSNVVREQLVRVVEKSPSTLERLEKEIELMNYDKMKEIWKQEENEREVAELGSDLVNELRRKLRPSIEQLVRSNRKNFMKQGYTFKKTAKKTLKDQYFFWRLDANEKVLTVIDCDVDPFIEGISPAGNQRKVLIKDLVDVAWGDDGDKTSRKSSAFSRGIRLHLPDGEVISASAHNDRDMITWVDGLCDLMRKPDISRDASRCVDRLLNVQLRLRLVDVPSPRPFVAPPPLPTDFSWIPLVDA